MSEKTRSVNVHDQRFLVNFFRCILHLDASQSHFISNDGKSIIIHPTILRALGTRLSELGILSWFPSLLKRRNLPMPHYRVDPQVVRDCAERFRVLFSAPRRLDAMGIAMHLQTLVENMDNYIARRFPQFPWAGAYEWPRDYYFHNRTGSTPYLVWVLMDRFPEIRGRMPIPLKKQGVVVMDDPITLDPRNPYVDLLCRPDMDRVSLRNALLDPTAQESILETLKQLDPVIYNELIDLFFWHPAQHVTVIGGA